MFRCFVAHLHAELGNEARRSPRIRGAAARNSSTSRATTMAGRDDLRRRQPLPNDKDLAAQRPSCFPVPSISKPFCQPEAGVASVARAVGVLQTVVGSFEVAAASFETAISANASMGTLAVPPHQHDYARMLIVADGPGDAERAEALLRVALGTVPRTCDGRPRAGRCRASRRACRRSRRWGRIGPPAHCFAGEGEHPRSR